MSHVTLFTFWSRASRVSTVPVESWRTLKACASLIAWGSRPTTFSLGSNAWRSRPPRWSFLSRAALHRKVTLLWEQSQQASVHTVVSTHLSVQWSLVILVYQVDQLVLCHTAVVSHLGNLALLVYHPFLFPLFYQEVQELQMHLQTKSINTDERSGIFSDPTTFI